MKKVILTVFAIALLSSPSFAQWNGVDAGGSFVLPEALAQYCEISQDDVASLTAVVECLNEILDLEEDAAGDVRLKAQRLAETILRQTVTINISEGLGHKVYAYDYPYKELEDLSESLSSASDNKDRLAAIAFLEQESAYLQNKIMQAKASEMQYNSLSHISIDKGGFQ